MNNDLPRRKWRAPLFNVALALKTKNACMDLHYNSDHFRRVPFLWDVSPPNTFREDMR